MPDAVDVAALRAHYARAALSEDAAHPDPLVQFEAWLVEAVAAGAREPNAMTLATASPDGRPSARVVLLKGVDARGLTFFTNLESRKAGELEANPRAALVFWWPEVERQVRVEGRVERVADAEADAYFASRPPGSRLGAWASPQSRPLPDRAALDARLAEVEARFAGADPPRPPFWGGFRVVPDRFEFWQGRPSRLHDRLEYAPDGAGGWAITRLAP
ncbi:MAG TPA: pyridoxamine 5'-phosphate oxidase [Rubricoccaceae bacterium]|nr:pyridoxamine 5'-phosphate oxidase [Rubricoccaceae bacterium]